MEMVLEFTQLMGSECADDTVEVDGVEENYISFFNS